MHTSSLSEIQPTTRQQSGTFSYVKRAITRTSASKKMSKNLQDLSLSDATESKNKLTKMDAPEIDRYERRVWRRRRRHRRLLTLTALIIIVVGCLQEIADASGATVAATAAAKNNNNDKVRRAARQHVGDVASPPSELTFTNNTGAVVTCGVAGELARSIARAEHQLLRAGEQVRTHDHVPAAAAAATATTHNQNDIDVRWIRSDTNEDVELSAYASQDSSSGGGEQRALLRYVRASDGALVFEPFRAHHFRADVHAATYKCVASTRSRQASAMSRDMRVRAIVSSTQQQQQALQAQGVPIEVQDELVVSGNSAVFSCRIPAHAAHFVKLVDWLEWPGDQAYGVDEAHTVQQQRETNNNSSSATRYFVAPQSGDLHIVHTDMSLNYRTYRCRCRNELTGELVVSATRGKLIVTEAHAPMAPRVLEHRTATHAGRLASEAAGAAAQQQQQQQQQNVRVEGQLALLACPVQAWPRADFVWYLRGSDQQQQQMMRLDEGAKYAQVANLLFVHKLNRSDSGTYVCVARNALGEERVELQLHVIGAALRTRLTASSQVLELGKSLALECNVAGYPVTQLVFRHNQNVIKTVSGVSDAQPAGAKGNYYVLDDDDDDNDAAAEPVDDELELLASAQTSASTTAAVVSAKQADTQKPQQRLRHAIVIVLEPQHAGAYQCFAYNQFGQSAQSLVYIRVLDDPPRFRDTFKSQVIEQRQDASLLCSARANPLPEITWQVDERPVPESGRVRFGDFVTKDNLVVSYVNISSAQVQDGGVYKCTADNGQARAEHEARLSVVGPVHVKHMHNLTVLASATLRARCPVVGWPIAEVQWQHPSGRRLPTNHRQHVYDNGTLEVEHVERSLGDEGEYVCVASSQPMTTTSSALSTSSPLGSQARGSLFVTIKVRPTIEPFHISRSLREGQRASVMCTISSGDLPISIAWFRDGRPIAAAEWPQDNSQQQQQQLVNASAVAGVRVTRVSDYSSTLLFESLVAEHSGNYTCVAHNDAGTVSHHAPMLVQVAPKWAIEPSDSSVVRGTSAAIDCVASGNPVPRIVWSRASSTALDSALAAAQSAANATQLQQQQAAKHHLGSWRSIVSSPHLQVHENGSLNILDARDSDHGHYMCQASNGVGAGLSKVIRVTINVGAQFSSRHSVQYVARGEGATLKCQAKGNWPLLVHWLKNKSSRLEPVNARDAPADSVANAGEQKPPVGARLIASTAAAVLQVPSGGVLDANLTPAARHKAASASVLEQLFGVVSGDQRQQQQQQQLQGHLIDKYTLHTVEWAANREPSAAEMSMGARARQSGGLSALANTIDVESDNAEPLVPLVAHVNSALQVAHADRHDTITFRCVAVNAFGYDERTVQLIVQEPPDAIDELNVLEVSSRTVTLGWLAPFDGNAQIARYVVQHKLVSTSGSAEFLRQQLAAVSTNWTNSTFSAASDASNSNANTVGGGGGSSTAASPASANLVRATVTGLRPVARYLFRVSAENKLGSSQPSTTAESVTMDEAPAAAPGKLKAQAQSSSTILVSWARLSDKDVFGSVHGYYVAYRPHVSPGENDNSGARSDAKKPVTTNIYKTIQHDDKLSKFDALLSGLKRSTMYMISVQAFNAGGTGPASEPVQVRTLDMDPPKQVRLFVRQTTNCTIQLEWRPLSRAAMAQLQQQQQGGRTSNDGQAEDSESRKLPVPMPLVLANAPADDQTDAAGQAAASWSAADVVDYYTLYEAELGDAPTWRETRVPGHASTHLVDNLRCGARYQFYMMGVNRIGVGDQSDILDTKTLGGLPIAPDKQLALDVLNATCFSVRLDLWQDNGCPIRSLAVRYRLESVLSASADASLWTQLAKHEFAPADGARKTRSAAINDETADELEAADSDSAMLDYMSDSAASLWPSDTADYSVLRANASEQARWANLLRDSMLPAIDVSESQQLFDEDLATDEAAAESRTRAKRARQEESSSSAADWRKVRLCSLLEGARYIVQIVAANSVGETSSEVRLWASDEGLEYDERGERRLAARLNLASGGAAQRGQHSGAAMHAIAMTDKISSALGLADWSSLLPLALTALLMFVIVFAAALLRTTGQVSNNAEATVAGTSSSSSSSSSSASTAATNSTSGGGAGAGGNASAHCHSYLNEPHLGSRLMTDTLNLKGLGAASAITDATCGSGGGTNNTALADSYALLERESRYPNATTQMRSMLDDNSPYGLAVGSPNHTRASLAAGVTDDLSRSSSSGNSPANSTLAPSMSASTTGQHQHNTLDGAYLQRARSIYMCSKQQTPGPSGNRRPIHSGHHTINVRQFHNQPLEQQSKADCSFAKQRHQVDNCFMNLVEEVARANETLAQQKQQQQQQQHQTYQSTSQETNYLQCNQYDCNQQFADTNSAPSDYASMEANQSDCAQQSQQQQQLKAAAAAAAAAAAVASAVNPLSAAEQLAMDPIYASIRRTFPQAFKYLTLQHPHNHQELQQTDPPTHLFNSHNVFCDSQQRHSLTNDTVCPSQIDAYNSQDVQQQQLYHQHQQQQHNLALLNLINTNEDQSHQQQQMR